MSYVLQPSEGGYNMSFNSSQGISTALQGAKFGGSFGGAWGAIGGGLIGLVTGGKAADREAEMTKKYNDQVVKYAAQDLFDMRRQQNVQNIRTAQALASYQDNQRVQTSSVVANMGAADIIGSSAKALVQTMDFQTKAAQAETMLNWQVGLDNYNTTIDQQTNQRSASLKRQQEGADLDVGALISGGVDIYNKFGKGQGAAVLADVRDAWNDRANAGSNIIEGLQGAQSSVMSSFKNIWSDSTSKMVTSGTQPSRSVKTTLNASVDDTFKTFALGR